MSGHQVTCESCGHTQYIQCDKRMIGVGRKHDVDWKPGPNHETVRKALYQMMSGYNWVTVKQVQAWLNNRVDETVGQPDEREWWHQGKSHYWNQLSVQTPVSDLLGIDVLEFRYPAKGRELLYRPNDPMQKVTA